MKRGAVIRNIAEFMRSKGGKATVIDIWTHLGKPPKSTVKKALLAMVRDRKVVCGTDGQSMHLVSMIKDPDEAYRIAKANQGREERLKAQMELDNERTKDEAENN